MNSFSRRSVLAGTTAALAASGLPALAQVPRPRSPLTLNIIDAAGNLALTQRAFDNYRRTKPEMVSRMVFTKAPSPEVPGKIKAQQDARRVDIDMVIVGTDALSAGLEQNLWTELTTAHASKLPNLQGIYQETAWRMQGLARGFGVVVSYYPSGPLLEYMPNKVRTPPTSAEELLAWAKQNPNRFSYARPANSGPGRTFLMGLPYILGDSDPKDPVNGWSKTWSFLREIGQYVENYPSGTAVVMKELGEGTRDIVVTTTGWDINPRVLGIVPKEAAVTTLRNFRWVADAHYLVIPKGVSDERLAVLLDLTSHLLTKESQAYTFDEGYFYPGPAVQGVTLDMAPKESQDAIREFGRPEYDRLIADNPQELPLDPDKLVIAFRRWDEEIGARRSR
ncbi:extracellular solute-binding protein [Roseomonas sp. BN140053]|uniref:extracellular solute-binding protein n=1 Tax=Roseomonas sp. BN140053 TaxID=3391898 RepID=UPI0039EA03B7